MSDQDKSKDELLKEVTELRKRVTELEELEVKHKQLEASLTETNKKFSMIIEHLPGMGYICLNDEHWTMKYVSSGCEELTGYKNEDLVDNKTISFNEVIHPSDRGYVWDHVQEALQKHVPWRLLYRIQTTSGQEKWVWERGVGVYSEDGRDVTLLGYIMNQAG